jgi:SAM-dependent methyltransferase
MKPSISPRFIDEDLAPHWRVDETRESFQSLLDHIDNKTNFRSYFEKAFADPALLSAQKNNVVIDIGVGVGWSSAIMATNPRISRVIAIEPSLAREKHIPFVADHFSAPKGTVEIVNGTFGNLGTATLADLIVLCGSFHHCWDHDIPTLFDQIKKLLKPGGAVLITNEHYVRWPWFCKRLLSWIKSNLTGRPVHFGPFNLNAPDPFDGEHWRTRTEISDIFSLHGFESRIMDYEGDLCKDKPRWIDTWGWTYYYAILKVCS